MRRREEEARGREIGEKSNAYGEEQVKRGRGEGENINQKLKRGHRAQHLQQYTLLPEGV